jgi:hypothetical protein
MVSDTMYPAPQAILKSLIPSLRTKIAHPLILRPNLKVKPDQILLERKHQLGSNSVTTNRESAPLRPQTNDQNNKTLFKK